MRKIIAILLIILFVFPLMLATLCTAAVSTWALDRKFYEDVLGNEKLYEALLSEDLPIYVNRHVVSDVDQVAVGALSNALRVVLTPQYMRSEAIRIVDDVFDFIEGQQSTLEIYLNLAPIKALVTGEKRQEFANALAMALPTCKPGEDSTAAGGVLTRCIQTNQTVDAAALDIYNQLPEYVAKYPDRLELSTSFQFSEDMGWSRPLVSFAGRSGLTLAVIILVVMTGGVWLLAAVIGSETWKNRLHWLGWSLVVPAGLVFLIGLVTNSNVTGDWVRYGLNQARFDGYEYTLTFQQTLWEALQPAMDRISSGFLVAGGAAGGIALALIIWAFTMPTAMAGIPRGLGQPYAAVPPQPYYPPAPPQPVTPAEPPVTPMQPMTPPVEPSPPVEPPSEPQP
jgi:hypothetical protein